MGHNPIWQKRDHDPETKTNTRIPINRQAEQGKTLDFRDADLMRSSLDYLSDTDVCL